MAPMGRTRKEDKSMWDGARLRLSFPHTRRRSCMKMDGHEGSEFDGQCSNCDIRHSWDKALRLAGKCSSHFHPSYFALLNRSLWNCTSWSYRRLYGKVLCSGMVVSIDIWSHTVENPTFTMLKQLHEIQERFLFLLSFTLHKKGKDSTEAYSIIKGTLLFIYCSFKCVL